MKNKEQSISVLIVDDHPVVRGGLEAMFRSEKGFRILGCTATGQEAFDLCQRQGVPDVVLLDVRMPDCDGFQTLHLLRRHFPGLRVLMLAGMPLKHEAQRARELGAGGYLSKSAEQTELLEAIRALMVKGDAFLVSEAPKVATVPLLSPREIEVLELLSRGLSREEIGTAINVSAETVKSHVKAILAKLEASGRTEAVARGYELGLLHI
jgi:DNA-binding NarL/FixJ family response regulator